MVKELRSETGASAVGAGSFLRKPRPGPKGKGAWQPSALPAIIPYFPPESNGGVSPARDLLAEWARQGQEAAPPAWEELPGIPLYMDQVILYLGESLELFQREGSSLLTSSMINNYVKTGLIPHPDKKKYTKEHLAGLMAVCMLKQVLPIQDIKTLFSGGMDPHTYALFRQAHTEALAETCRSLEETCASGADLKQAALLLAAEANAKRAAAQRILSLLGEDVPKKPKEKGEGKGGNS